MKISKKVIGAGAVVVLVAVFYVYEIALPNSAAKTYKDNLRSAVTKLDGSMAKISDSTTRTVFTNVSGSTLESDKNDIVIIRQAITTAQADIKDAKAKAGDLKKYPLSGYFGAY
jgi:hypothetical protein